MNCPTRALATRCFQLARGQRVLRQEGRGQTRHLRKPSEERQSQRSDHSHNEILTLYMYIYVYNPGAINFALTITSKLMWPSLSFQADRLFLRMLFEVSRTESNLGSWLPCGTFPPPPSQRPDAEGLLGSPPPGVSRGRNSDPVLREIFECAPSCGTPKMSVCTESPKFIKINRNHKIL